MGLSVWTWPTGIKEDDDWTEFMANKPTTIQEDIRGVFPRS
jgi:hypothetical protein